MATTRRQQRPKAPKEELTEEAAPEEEAPAPDEAAPDEAAPDLPEGPSIHQVFAALQRERVVRQELEAQVGKLYGENVELRRILKEQSDLYESTRGE